MNVTSLVTRGLPFRASYAASKAALGSLTRTMAVELAADVDGGASVGRLA